MDVIALVTSQFLIGKYPLFESHVMCMHFMKTTSISQKKNHIICKVSNKKQYHLMKCFEKMSEKKFAVLSNVSFEIFTRRDREIGESLTLIPLILKRIAHQPPFMDCKTSNVLV